MKRIYLALAVYSTVFFLVAAGLGLELHAGAGDTVRDWHVRGGLFAAMFLVFVHSTVFIHLLGTGLGAKRAIEEHGLPEDAKADLYRFKMRAFPPCMASMLAVIATAVLGGAALSGHATAHLVSACVALAINLAAFPIAVRQLGENEALLRRLEAMVHAKARPTVEEKSGP
ncbi:hypothetical protein HY251_06705 [bacterium]|nr:hypothetical protein [bacterium]